VRGNPWQKPLRFLCLFAAEESVFIRGKKPLLYIWCISRLKPLRLCAFALKNSRYSPDTVTTMVRRRGLMSHSRWEFERPCHVGFHRSFIWFASFGFGGQKTPRIRKLRG
jgi:hypothetical protein